VLEDKVFEYVGHRMNQGVDLTDVVGEKYVRRNAFGREIDNKWSNPRIVDAARKHLQEVFRSEELDFDKRRSNETG
jgi:hypothetical protein